MAVVPDVGTDLYTPSATAGKIVLTITTTLTTSFPTGEAFSCGLKATVADVASGLTFSDTIFINATKSGNTLSCTATLPYSWDLVSSTQDVMLVLYTINATNGTGNPTRVAQHGVASVRDVALHLHNTGKRDRMILDEYLTTVCHLGGEKILCLDTFISDVEMLNDFFV